MGARKQRKTVDQEDEVDYGAMADEYASASEEDEANEEEVESESEDEESVSDDDESVEQEEEGSEEDEEEDVIVPQINTTSATGEPCTFDLRNLMAMNYHQINSAKLRSSRTEDDDITIPATSSSATVDEQYLLKMATDGCSQLIEALWQLPIESSDVGAMAKLPTHDESAIPRSLPPPAPKQETKWEKYAREKGIPLNKQKRSQKVWDETTGTWMYRHGYNKANDDSKEWPIMEVKGNEDPYADPWEKLREAKRSKVEKNLESRLRNKERAGELAKGSTTRLLKNREKTRQKGKAGGDLDRALSVGVPVDMPSNKASSTNPRKRGKESLTAALKAAQLSTASLGKFDKMREGEPERKKTVAGSKKRRFESATDKKVISGETERSMKVLKQVIDGGGKQKEQQIRKGRFAKGETAYDHEFDDGLGASSFRKKKGRAGAGKMKKMTKKRVK